MWITDIALPPFFGSKVIPLHKRVAPEPQRATSGPRVPTAPPARPRFPQPRQRHRSSSRPKRPEQAS